MKKSSFVYKLRTMVFASFVSVMVMAGCSYAANWVKKETYTDKMGNSLTVTMTYYAAEFIEQHIQAEANKNLWTNDELENYKYRFMRSLQLDEYIPIYVKFENRGSALRMNPFENVINLQIGSKTYKPVDYDKRFNIKVDDEREGFVYFPRFNDKGEPLLKGVKTVRVNMNNSFAPVVMNKNVYFLWDVADDRPERLNTGKAAERLELDRLMRRVDGLNDKKEKLQKELNEVNFEINMIDKRIGELQKN